MNGPARPEGRLEALRRRLPTRRRRAPLPLIGRSGARPAPVAASLLRLSLAVLLAYGGLAGGLAYWQVVEAQRLSSDPQNPLVLAAARQAPRGSILDATGTILARNVQGSGREPLRQYPVPEAAPVVGYSSPIYGTSGLERAYDAQLTGLRSLRQGDELFRKFRAQPYDPNDLLISLDVRLQRAAARLLGDRHGAVVAIEPATGRVLAMVSNPTFDPNRLVDPETGRRYVARLRERDDSPLLNRATQGLYVPGSVFKIVTASAGLGSGSIRPETTYESQPEEYETGFLVSGFRIRDFPRNFQTDHPLDLYEATEVSSNIWYAHAGLDTGPENLLEWARRYGFGERLPFELSTQPSQVTGGDGPLEGFLDRVELANAAYGQGQVLVTPLQMALVAATVANEGLLMRPKLVDSMRSASGQETRLGPESWRQVLSPSQARVISDAMQLAVEGEFGRQLAGRARVPGVPTAGKSGTAQLAEDQDPHSWFIGFAPADNPQIAIAVIVERGGAGAQQAVPMAGELMEHYLGLPR
ncbi:MAG TPA: penicillin-binding transpeptidase domain-containing protein [Candidatus Limnocylindria bacterium]|nr:penicillin-binding transpeptidase domain-containing protein [Candidatus Limnocylindria bacterium]